jgi:endoribonuclease LACTB2
MQRRGIVSGARAHMFDPILLPARNPGPMTGSGNNTYLLVGDRGSATLIDAGVGEPEHLADIDRMLKERRARLDRVLVTHGHPDHAGGAAPVSVAYPDVSFAKLPWPGQDASYAVAWQTLTDGQAVIAGDETLVVLHTPGHSPDHIALWHEPSRTIFTGDLVVAGSSVMIHWSRGGDLGQYMASLERLLALEPAQLLPAHGAIVADPRALLTSYIEHRRMRERQVLEALRAGRSDVQGIAEYIYDGLVPALMPAARENVRAHLEKLKTDGLAAQDDERWRL